MKTDRAALLWGIVIALAIVAVIVFLPPNFHLPFDDRWIELGFVTALLVVGLVHVYQKLWKRAVFWLLLLGFVAVNLATFGIVIFKLTEGLSLVQQSATFAVVGGAEAFAFGVVIFRVFHVGPKSRPLSW